MASATFVPDPLDVADVDRGDRRVQYPRRGYRRSEEVARLDVVVGDLLNRFGERVAAFRGLRRSGEPVAAVGRSGRSAHFELDAGFTRAGKSDRNAFRGDGPPRGGLEHRVELRRAVAAIDDGDAEPAGVLPPGKDDDLG